MIDHVTLRVTDLAASRRFYDTVLAPLGIPAPTDEDEDSGFLEWGDFSIAGDEGPVARHVHVAFAAASRSVVDAFHAAGVAGGYRSNGEPGERPQYHPGYYGAFLLDPDGNNVEAVFHDRDAAR
jgi:catechol 2,3-dioxygenase-like lactoylglutathione lyase family enzyme